MIALSSCKFIFRNYIIDEQDFEYYDKDFEINNAQFLSDSFMRTDGAYFHLHKDGSIEIIKVFKSGLITNKGGQIKEKKSLYEYSETFPFEMMNYRGFYWGFLKFIKTNQVLYEIRSNDIGGYKKDEKLPSGERGRIIFQETGLLYIQYKDTLLYTFHPSPKSTDYPIPIPKVKKK